MNYFMDALKKYAVFSGRARRSEYWYFFLFIMIANIVLSGIDYVVLNAADSGFAILSSIFSLAILLPTIGVSVRRLHDTGKVGWWYLIAFIPLGGLVLLYFFVQDSEPDNQYGPCPK